MKLNHQRLRFFFINLKITILKFEHKAREYFSAKGADIYTRFVRRMFFVIILAFVAAALAAGIVLMVSSIAKPLTKIPSVKGMNIVDASLLIQEKGLQVEIDSKFDQNTDKFTVIDQFPKKGITVRRGRVVTILVSMGKDVYTVPKLVGLQRQEAEQLLFKMNINYEISVIQTPDFAVNTVVGQDIPPDTEVERSVKLKILVNSDVSRGETRIADYSRQNIDMVVKTLAANSIQPILEKIIAKNPDEDGLVLSQSVAAGTVVQKNSDILLSVGVYGENEDEKNKFKYYIFTYFLESTNTVSSNEKAPTNAVDNQANVRVTLVDEKNEEQEIYNKSVNYGEYVITTFKAYGKVKLNLIINNSFIKEAYYE